MAVTKVYRVYGENGHRQRESFRESYKYDFSTRGNKRVIEVRNADKTGTHEYTEVAITRNTAEECRKELAGQISDGIFENSRTGEIVEVGQEPGTAVEIIYDYESACGAKIRHHVLARNDRELTEYIRRLVKAQYEVVAIVTIR